MKTAKTIKSDDEFDLILDESQEYVDVNRGSQMEKDAKRAPRLEKLKRDRELMMNLWGTM